MRMMAAFTKLKGESYLLALSWGAEFTKKSNALRFYGSRQHFVIRSGRCLRFS